MAVNDVAICNSALIKCGAAKITALSDTNRRAILCNEQYNKIRKKLLRNHPWKFASKQVHLVNITDTSDSITAATDIFTSKGAIALNGLTGDRTTLTLVSGTLPTGIIENLEYFIISVTGTTFKLAATADDANAGTAIDLTDNPTFEATFSNKPAFRYGFKFALPSDYIRATRQENEAIAAHDRDWTRFGAQIYADEETINIEYVYDVTDTTLFEASFDELFAQTLAVDISYSLVQSVSLKAQLKEELRDILADARSFNAQEGEPEYIETNEWLNSRI